MRSDGSDPQRLTEESFADTSPVWSPDGRPHRLCLRPRRQPRGIRDGCQRQRMCAISPSRERGLDAGLVTPDGKRIAFASFRDGNWEIYVMDARRRFGHAADAERRR